MQAVMETPSPPPRFQADVNIGKREHRPENTSHQHSPPGELAHVRATLQVKLLKPLPFDFLRGALERLDGNGDVLMRDRSFFELELTRRLFHFRCRKNLPQKRYEAIPVFAYYWPMCGVKVTSALSIAK